MAKEAQLEIYESCMILRGWEKIWVSNEKLKAEKIKESAEDTQQTTAHQSKAASGI